MPQQKEDDWEDIDWEDEEEPSSFGSSLWNAGKSVWDAVNKPIFSQPAPNATHPLAKFGNFVTDLITPLNVATGGSTGAAFKAARAGLPTIAKGLNYAGRALSAPVAAEGIHTLSNAEDWTDVATGGLETIGGIAGIKQKLPRISAGKLKTAAQYDDDLINVNKRQLGVDEPFDNVSSIRHGADDWVDDIVPEKPIVRQPSQEWMDEFVKPESVVDEIPIQQKPTKVILKQNDPQIISDLSKDYDFEGLNTEGHRVFKLRKADTGMIDDAPVKPISEEPFRPKHTDLEPTVGDDFTAAMEGSLNEPNPNIQANKPLAIRAEEIKAVIPQAQIPGKIRSINQTARAAKLASKEEKEGIIRQALDFNRTLLTAYDMSAPLRQGLPLLHRKEWFSSLDDMFKSWGSERSFKTVMDSIYEHPSGYFKGIEDPTTGKISKSFGEMVGLDLATSEEVFRSKLAEKIPGVRMSNRAFTGFLSKLRSDTFVSMVDDAKALGKDPETDLVLARSIADFINNATGRGNLGKLEPAAEILSNVFFAPRLMASRVNMYSQVLNPKFYSELDPQVRKEAIKSLLTVAGFGTTIGELAKLAGANVINDPTNTDFRKIKIGNTRIDPFGGFQQYFVAATRLITGKSTSSVSGKVTDLTSGKFGRQNRADIASRFFANKLAPLPSFVWSWMENKEFDGEPFEVKRALFNRTVPIVMQDLQELAQEDPKLIPLIIPAGLGMGVQSYGR